LLEPQRIQRRMVRRIARAKPMLTSLQMRLPDEIDDAVVIKRMNYIFKQ
jgi:hypothetical protein